MGCIFCSRKQLFGQIAVKKGLASQQDITAALRIQKAYKERQKIHKEIGAILIEKGILTPNNVRDILEEQKKPVSIIAWFTALFNLNR